MRSPGSGSMLGQRRRRWASIEPTSGEHKLLLFLYVNDCVMGNVRVYHGYFFQSIHITYLSVSCLSRLN